MNTLMNDKTFIGTSNWSNKIREEIDRIAGYPSTVLITGPTGTGKEVIAELIHAKSSRAKKPMLTVDCTSLPDSLFESQLFGHVKGAFTGAENDTLGMFRAAEGGTILLDEIGELEPSQQAKLLRVLQTKTITPVGSHKPVKVDVRVIAATNRDLEEEVRQGRFRSDLFYRLNVVTLDTQPLAERKDDIDVLSQFFLDQFADQNGWPRKTLSPAAGQLLQAYEWPGNVRELENLLERAALYSTDDVVGCGAFPALADLREAVDEENYATFEKEDGATVVEADDVDVDSHSAQPSHDVMACVEAATANRTIEIGEGMTWVTLEELERFHIDQTLRQTFYNQSAAARLLNVSRQSLIRKVKQYEIELPFKEMSDRQLAAM